MWFRLLKRRDATSSCSQFRLLAWDQLPPIVEGWYRTKFQLLNVRPRSAQGFHSNYKMYDNVWNYYTLQDTTTSSSWSWKVSLSNCLKLCRPDLTLRWPKKKMWIDLALLHMFVLVLGACLRFRTSQRQQVPFPGMPKHTAWTTGSKHSRIQGLEIQNGKLRFCHRKIRSQNYQMQPPHLLNMILLLNIVDCVCKYIHNYVYLQNTNDTLEGIAVCLWRQVWDFRENRASP